MHKINAAFFLMVATIFSVMVIMDLIKYAKSDCKSFGISCIVGSALTGLYWGVFYFLSTCPE